MKKKKFYVLLFFFIFCFKVSAQDQCQSFNGPNQNLKPVLLKIETFDTRKWTKNLLKLLTETKNINKSQYKSLDKYRKYHQAKIKVFFDSGIICEFKGKIKIHGGTRNHRNNITQHTSIRVKLFENNILNTTHFALLIPKSRN